MPILKFQCSKCGKQRTISSGTPGQEKCPNGGYHVWARLGRFIKQVIDLL